jgi:hypothetical protein
MKIILCLESPQHEELLKGLSVSKVESHWTRGRYSPWRGSNALPTKLQVQHWAQLLMDTWNHKYSLEQPLSSPCYSLLCFSVCLISHVPWFVCSLYFFSSFSVLLSQPGRCVVAVLCGFVSVFHGICCWCHTAQGWSWTPDLLASARGL